MYKILCHRPLKSQQTFDKLFLQDFPLMKNQNKPKKHFFFLGMRFNQNSYFSRVVKKKLRERENLFRKLATTKYILITVFASNCYYLF